MGRKLTETTPSSRGKASGGAAAVSAGSSDRLKGEARLVWGLG